MNLRRLTPVLTGMAFALFAASGLAAQTGTVTGTVTDAATGAPIAGAQLVIQGTNVGGLSNAEGRYLITAVPTGAQMVRVVNIGYAQQTQQVDVTAGGSVVADFQLQASAIELGGLVVNTVTGRTQRARELGTNVGTIDLRNVEPAKVTSVADVLSGRTEGVILQDVNGTAGSSQRIRIRGANSLSLSNEPLVYIDGVLSNSASALSIGVGGQESSRLNDLNPNDIESIEVVKGPAAAALYGTAAANGVLLITTKRGRAGAAEWNVYAEVGQVEDNNDYPTNYLSYQVIGNGSAPFFTETGAFNSTDYVRCSNREAAAGICTQDGTTTFNTLMDSRTTPFSTGTRERYGASVRGGSERVTYYVSGELEDEVGVIDYNTRDRISVRANLNAAVSDNFDLSVSSGYSTVQNDFNSNDNSIFSPILNGLLGEGYFIPESAKSEGSLPGVHRSNYGFGFNQWDNANYVINDNVDRVTLGAQASYRPLNWLSVNANGGLDLVSGHTFRTLQPGLLPIAASWDAGFRTSHRASDYTYTLNASSIASFELTEDILSTTTVGGSFNQETLQRTECQGSSLIQGTSSCGTTAALFAVDEDFTEIRTVGGYVQTEIAWRDRVFVAAALRGDDNSAFGADFGFVTYPSASVSWVIGEEDFFPESEIVNELRVRAAFGESGLRPGFRDALDLFDAVTVAANGQDVPGITVDATGNVDLKPERSREYELGLDAGLFNGRVGVDFTYFSKTSRDALISRRLPPSWGVDATRFENLGEIRNSGTELSVNVNAVDMDNFGFNLIGTLTTLDNEVVRIGEGVEDIVFNRGLQRHKEGFPAGSFFQQEIFWNDADGNGLLTDDEVTLSDGDPEFIGPSLPTWQTSVGGDVRLWDWLNVSTLFEARGGNYQGNDSEAFRCGFRSTRGCSAVGNPDAPLEEQARYIADRFLQSAYGFIEKADFLKWRELSFTLRAPESLVRSAPQLEGVSVTLAGRNLATWTDYTGLDPETVEGGGSVNFSQSEFNTQPPVRHLMIRVNYNF